ncbi:recombinase family protein [Vibrio parahaemolyticus]|nr:recombinase family protein [Vibrio parahaemolyticus]MBM5050399.1 recombinase family protein [Vibrio parahaemolyticus]MBM5077845.1 recombinase family protein [Vibrio parahaemolyticus]
MKYGYAVRDNDLAMQLKALDDFGCDDIQFGDDLPLVVDKLKQGDVVAVWRLDKLANSVAEVERVLNDVHSAGASVELLFERLNSGSNYKEVLSQLIGVMKQIEKL